MHLNMSKVQSNEVYGEDVKGQFYIKQKPKREVEARMEVDHIMYSEKKRKKSLESYLLRVSPFCLLFPLVCLLYTKYE
jgi:hypothetical protein